MSATTATFIEPNEQAADTIRIDPEANAFCVQHQLIDALAETVRLLREFFPANLGVEVLLKHDPDIADVSWLSVLIRGHGTPSELVQTYDLFLDRWVSITPPHVRERINPTFTLT